MNCPQLWRPALLCIVLALPATSVLGMEFHPVFRVLDAPGGLPDQHVEAIVQDTHGYVWIGTRGGLVRHEGRELRVLPRDPDHPGALPDNNITSLHAHSDGMVWAAVSDAGVVEIGPDLLPRRHLAPATADGPLPHGQIWAMGEDCQGRLWLAFMRGGLARFDPVSEQILLIPQQESQGLSETALQMELMLDRDCRLWLAQSNRLVVADLNADEIHFQTALGPTEDLRDFFLALIDHSELGVLASRGRDLFVLDQDAASGEDYSWSRLASFDGLITGLGELPDQRIVVATARGLAFVDPDNGSIEQVGARPDLPDGLPVSDFAGATLVDREGAIWLALVRRGLVYLAPEHTAFARLQRGFGDENQRFELERVSVTAPGQQENILWLGGSEGVQRLDLQSGEIRHARELFIGWPEHSSERIIRGIWERADQLVMLEAASLSVMAGSAPAETLLNRADVNNTTFQFLFPAGADALWLGTATAGLLHYELEGRTITRYGPDEPGARMLPETAPVAMVRSPTGELLLAGSTRLYRYQPALGFELVADLERGRTVDLAYAPDGSLWIAQDAGLSQWHWDGERAKRLRDFPLQELTQAASIRQVLPIRPNEVWLVLSNGVARLDPQSEEIRSFTRADGLPVAEFAPRSASLLANGRIVVGGSRGLLLLNPAEILDRAPPPMVQLTRISAADLNQVLVPGEREPIALDWRQNSVRFEFSALSYVAPERVRYRVRLHGWDEEWIELRDLGQMYYSNLRPGRYRFHVLAAAGPAEWTGVGDEITIAIAAPPWASPPAFAAYAVLLALALAASGRAVRQARIRRRYLSEIQQKRALAEDQRKLLERLNADLEPIPLARAIVAELTALTGASQVWFGYVHEQMPRDLVGTPGLPPLSRDHWRQLLEAADGGHSQVVNLRADEALIARVLLQAPAQGFQPDHAQRLALLLDQSEQVLHNSLLLQRVKRLAERAEAANQAKSDFLATMSHEIRTPLHGVMGMAELLHEGEIDPGRLQMINTLRASGRQLKRVIDDILDISSIEAGRLSIKHESFELVSLLEDLLDLYAPNAARKGLDLRLRLHSALPVHSAGDPDRLVQILGNLLSNALKFTEHGGIELSVDCPVPGQLRFAVSDSGPGIDPVDRERLFQPFSQLDSSIRREHGGSGLGLAICRRLATSMGGSLILDTRCRSGSRFVLSLPNGSQTNQPPLSLLLQDVQLVALLDPPTYRVALRLARRWGFGLSNGWVHAPQPGSLLLIDRGSLKGEERAAAWLQGAVGGWLLESPYPRFVDAYGTLPEGFRFLRWPLLEGRLVAALADRVLEAC